MHFWLKLLYPPTLCHVIISEQALQECTPTPCSQSHQNTLLLTSNHVVGKHSLALSLEGAIYSLTRCQVCLSVGERRYVADPKEGAPELSLCRVYGPQRPLH